MRGSILAAASPIPFPNAQSFLIEGFRARAGGDAVTATREYQNAAGISSGKPPEPGELGPSVLKLVWLGSDRQRTFAGLVLFLP